MSSHPLAAILDDAAAGRFPPADGATDVLPPDADGTIAVVALTGHAYVLADVDPGDIATRVGDDERGGFGGVLTPALLAWLACDRGRIGSTDVVLVTRGIAGAAADGFRRTDRFDDHPRVRRAGEHRRDLEVFADDAGVVIIGRGLVGRGELSVELLDPLAPASGAGRRLIEAGLRRVPTGEWCWAQVAPGNARSLRAFLACGFVPIGSEVLIT